MRRSAVRDRRALFIDKVLYWLVIVGLMVATVLYLLKEAAKITRKDIK